MFDTLLLFPTQRYSNSILHFVAKALHRPQRSADTQSERNNVNTSSFPYIEVLRGRDGRDGRDGVPGPRGLQGQKGVQGLKGDHGAAGPPGPTNGGVVYTRWGKSSCPSVSGTTLVYAGRAGGTWYAQKGGAANYLCMPDDPDYLSYQPGVQGHNFVFGAEYQTGGPLSAVNQHNVPCAVCYASTRVAVTMIPAKTRCPSTWTLEYSGYLMSERRSSDRQRTLYECVDKNPDSVPGSVSDANGALFYHVEASCNGMLCPPYDAQKELTCAVCTK